MRSSDVFVKDKIAFMSASTTNIDKNYVLVSVFDAFGYTYRPDGTRVDVEETAAYDQTMLGKKFITNPEQTDGAFTMQYSVPIFDEDLQPSGAVYAVIKADRLSAVCGAITVGRGSHPRVVDMRTGLLIGDESADAVKARRNLRDESTGGYADIIARLGIDQIDAVFAENDNMAWGAIDALRAAGAEPGRRPLVISFDAVRESFNRMVKGEINCDCECNPLHGPRVAEIIRTLERGETVDRIQYVSEGVFDETNAAQALPMRAY